MIIYSKTLWGLPLLTRIYGSALPRAIAPAVFSGLITMMLLLLGDRVQHLWENPFAYQPFVLIVSFVLTFRSNLAYQRHWEALSQVQIMTARWMDAATQVIMFDKHPTEPVQPHQQLHHPPSAVSSSVAAGSHHQFVSELVHLISLLHGLSCAALRRDSDLANLTRHSRLSAAPPSDPALLLRTSLPDAAGAAQDDAASPRASVFRHWTAAGDVNIIGAANWRDIFMLRGSSSAISKYHAAQPLPIIGGVSKQEVAALGCRHDLDAEQAVGLCTEEHWGGVIAGRYPGALQTHNKPRNHSSMSAANLSGGNPSNSHLWGFLRQRQQQQQGPPQQAGVLQQMHHRSHHSFTEGAAGAAVSIAGSAKSGKSGNGGKSLMKRSLSRRFKTSTNHACCIRHLPYMDRPMLVLAWIHELLLERQIEGGLRIPAPILARVHTCLSDGLVGFEQCRKLADTPFPFPWAQFVLLMLVIFTVTLPLLVLAYVAHSVLAVVVTVMTVSTYWAVNEVARDVEDPFLYEPNDLPLANSQYHINELLLALSAAQRPASGMTPALLPMAAAAASGCGSGLSSLSYQLGSTARLRSAASASWPNVRHAATAGEADQSRIDAEFVDGSTGLAAHGRLPTIPSEEVGFLSCATHAAGGDNSAAAASLPESPFAAAELHGGMVAAVRPEKQADKQQTVQQQGGGQGPSKQQWQHVQRQTDQHSATDSSILRAHGRTLGCGGLDGDTDAGVLLDAAAKRPVRSSNGGNLGSCAGSAGVCGPVDHDTVSPRDDLEPPVVTAVEAGGGGAGGQGESGRPAGFVRHSWSGVALLSDADTGTAGPGALQRVSWRDSFGNRAIADMV